MMYLDTHIIVWLYSGEIKRFSSLAVEMLNTQELFVSPMVELELQFLNEIKKITSNPQKMLGELHYKLGLKVYAGPLDKVVYHSLQLHWTRDPFDRLIVANAIADDAQLLTKDSMIRDKYQDAIWD